MLIGLLALAAGIGILILADARKIAFVLGLSAVSNASSVIENRFGIQGYLLPLSLAVIAIALTRWLRHGCRIPAVGGAHSGDLLIGPVLVALVFASAAIGPFVSAYPASSAFFVGLLAKDLLFIVAVTIAVVVADQGLRFLLAGVAIGGFILATVTNAQGLLGLKTNDLSGFGTWRVQPENGASSLLRASGPFGGDPNSYAQHLVVAFAIVGAVGLTTSRRRERWLAAIMGASIAGALVLTSSRSGLVAAVVVLVVGALFAGVRPSTVGICAAAGAGVVLSTSSNERLLSLTQLRPGSDAIADPALQGRASEAIAAVEMFAERPLTGMGYGTYPDEYLQYARGIGLDGRFEPRSAHSLPLEIAAEQGLIGLTVATLVVCWAVATILRLRRRDPLGGACLASALIGFAATSVFLHDVYPRIMWALLAAVVAASMLEALGRRVERPPVSTTSECGPRVAMLIQNYLPAIGGAEHQLANLGPLLVARGIEPVVVTRSLRGSPTRETIDGVQVVRIPVWGPKPLRSILYIMGARSEIRRLRPDVIHAFDTLSPSTIALGHAHHAGTPTITKILRSGPIGDLAVLDRKPRGSLRLARLVDGVDTFIAISSDVAQELRNAGVNEERIAEIPNGVDTFRFRPGGASSGQPEQPRVVVTGRLAPEKRIGELASRWDRVQAKFPEARLVLVGEGPERPRLESTKGTDVLGRRDDVDDVLRSATIYVSASSAEGLSNSLLEAMATGLPCVVTDVGGVGDVIRPDVDGVIVDPDDLDGLVEAVIDLLRDPGRRSDLGRSARERVGLGWSLSSTADRLNDLYRAHVDASSTRAGPTLGARRAGTHEDVPVGP